MARSLPCTVLMLAALTSAGAALAAEIKVLTAGAYKPVVMALAPAFEQRTGHRLVVDNDTAGALVRRIGAGEAFDLVLLTPAALAQLVVAGKLPAGGSMRLARVAIGVAVKQGTPLPDISSVAAFQRSLLAARAVAYIDPAAGGSSGIYLAQLFETMGIAAQIKPKAVLVPGGLVALRVVSGEADIGIHQISEILAVPGATLVGPLPAEIQNYTLYAGAVSATARDAGAARALLDLLASAAAAAGLKDKGREAPGRRWPAPRSAGPAAPLLAQHEQVKALDLFARPGRAAQELQARRHARVALEAAQRQVLGQARPAVVLRQPGDDGFECQAMQGVARLRGRGLFFEHGGILALRRPRLWRHRTAACRLAP